MSVYGMLQPAPLFPLRIVAGFRGVERISIGDALPECDRDDSNALVREAARQLAAYFEGRLREFDLPLDPRGTAFHHRVWAALRRIPYGEVRSYADIAREIGSVPRAVGQANGANPIAIVLPCHRVIAQDGSLAGYAAGVERKKYLVDMERACVLGLRARAHAAE